MRFHTPTTNSREEKGLTIAQLNGQVKRIDDLSYVVKSQSGNGEYQVFASELGWLCSCADHIYRGQKCKHIFSVEFSQKLRETVVQSVVIKPIDSQSCVRCGSSVVRDAKRKTKFGEIQRWRCRSCGKRMSFNLGFKSMRASPQTITTCMQLYFSGESLRGVQKFLALQGVQKSHMAVYGYIKRYVSLMDTYLQKVELQPQVSDTWRADELFLKVKGNKKYMYAMMDDQTRYWLALQVADSKYTEDVVPLFQRAKTIAGKKPMTLITDGAANFADGYKREFWTTYNPRTTHVRHITIQGDHNNNKMERLNGEIRDREKTMRGVKKMDTPILKGYQQYHNYFRPHEGLAGKTPAEVAGIKIEGQNKWITVIQNATKHAGMEI